MSAYLSWPEARSEAEAGKLVRREAWPLPGSDRAWLRRRAVLWESLDKRLASLGIVEAAEFTSAEFFATDWTTDDVGTVRDSCQRPAPRLLYAPPGIRLTGRVTDKLLLTGDLGASAPNGVYEMSFFLYGLEVARVEVESPGRATVEVTFAEVSNFGVAMIDPWGQLDARLSVQSRSPLPQWEGVAFWMQDFPSSSFTAINLATHFPGGGFINPPGYPYGDGVLFPSVAFDRWVYSHSDDPASPDNNIEINSVRFYYEPRYFDAGAGWFNLAGPIAGGETTFLAFLPANQSLRLNVWDAGGSYGASGSVRLYNRPL